ncbi:MAG: hypothetical protein GQ559_06260 [Desulfobulbaceae bacterium]|nr:hypothetical protein [Desulfobulbaceae bacterium]
MNPSKLRTVSSGFDLQKICSGYCHRCGEEHVLPEGNVRRHCLELMEIFKKKKRIDLKQSDADADPEFSTEYLIGEARGKMFGVMECLQKDGTTVVLRAFSGQYNGNWELDGWVGPLFDVNSLTHLSRDVEREVKRLGREIDLLPEGALQRTRYKQQRKALSRKLMRDIHTLYGLTNFRGDSQSLYEVFSKGRGIPTGVGDCCAPKLLNHAAGNGLIPLGVAEFYWGRENPSASRQHGGFYPPCTTKCRPILGFMLCGLNELRDG